MTAPTPGIGLKRRISREVKIVNLDEFRTSALSFKKEEYCENLEILKAGKKRHMSLALDNSPLG